MENQVIVSDYTQMDRVLREERNYILDIVKKIKKVGCNVLLIQKSILRSGVTDFLRETLIPLSRLKKHPEIHPRVRSYLLLFPFHI